MGTAALGCSPCLWAYPDCLPTAQEGNSEPRVKVLALAPCICCREGSFQGLREGRQLRLHGQREQQPLVASQLPPPAALCEMETGTDGGVWRKKKRFPGRPSCLGRGQKQESQGLWLSKQQTGPTGLVAILVVCIHCAK